jgi:spore coat polysaccharide biosynthesis predicted glycosyltransferase SpsG
VVSFGGADPVNATGLVLEALGHIPWLEVKVLVGAANSRVPASAPAREVLVDVADVAPSMAWAEVGICAPSTTCWELAYLGVPSLALILADNQVGIGERLDTLNAMRLLGDARRPPSLAELTEQIRDFLEDPLDRASIVTSASTLSDGRGVERVIAALNAAV